MKILWRDKKKIKCWGDNLIERFYLFLLLSFMAANTIQSLTNQSFTERNEHTHPPLTSAIWTLFIALLLCRTETFPRVFFSSFFTIFNHWKCKQIQVLFQVITSRIVGLKILIDEKLIEIFWNVMLFRDQLLHDGIFNGVAHSFGLLRFFSLVRYCFFPIRNFFEMYFKPLLNWHLTLFP